MSKQLPTNIKLFYPEHGDASVSCVYDGKRYHVWLDKDTLKPRVSHVGHGNKGLYCNPLDTSLRPSDIGYFHTRHMDIDGATGRVIVPLMLAEVPKLLQDAKAQLAREKQAEAIKHKEAVRLNTMREAAPALFSGLVWALRFIETYCPPQITGPATPEIRKVRELVKRIEKAGE